MIKPLKKLRVRGTIASIFLASALSGCGDPLDKPMPATTKRLLLPPFEKEFNALAFADNDGKKCEISTAPNRSKAIDFDNYYYYKMSNSETLKEVDKQLNDFVSNPVAFTTQLQILTSETGVVLDFTKEDFEKDDINRTEDVVEISGLGGKKLHVVYLANESTVDERNAWREKVLKISQLKITAIN